MTTGENIKRIRKAKGWTQKRLASEMGVTQAAITQWENSTRTPKKETLKKIAGALAVSIGELDGDYCISERDRPMEVAKIGFNSPGMMTARCPNCNCYIDAVPPRHIYNYCWNCGQSLEWRDEYNVDGIKLTFERVNP